jgi:Rho termination factor, N-terminal domain
MDETQRRDRIVSYLRIKPVNHGQIYTFQIAIPPSEDIDILFERREYLKMSLTQQGTNLIPLLVRRTEAYSEEEEYELVYGTDWCLVAKELDIEKLWVWVFDMTDEEAATAKEEMRQLLEMGKSEPSQVVVETNTKELELIQPIIQQLNKLFQQVATLSNKIDLVSASVKELQRTENQPKLGDDLINQIITTVKQVMEETITKIPESLSKPTPIIDNEQKDYNEMTVPELKSIASKRKIKGRSKMKKQELITALQNSDKK